MADEKVSVSVALRVAQDALAKGHFQEVVKQCKVVLKQDRNIYDGYVLLGSALFQLKQYAPAEKALRLAIGVNNSKIAAWQRLVEIYELTANNSQFLEACEETRARAKILGKPERYIEYTQKLATALVANSEFKKAGLIWQELIDNPSTPETLRFEAVCGLSDAKAALLEKTIQDEYKKRLSQNELASSSSETSREERPSNDCTTASADEDVLLLLEEEFVDRGLSREVEELLRKTTSEVGPHLEHHHDLLLRLLVRRVRAARHSGGEVWRNAKLKALQHCLTMMTSSMSMSAFEVAFRLIEDDDSKDLLEVLCSAQPNFKHRVDQPLVWVGRRFARSYPGHCIALAALAYAMHCNTNYVASWERKRVICEKALRLDDCCVTGWQVLAEVHVQQDSYPSAAECVRRGLQAVSRSRMTYGVGLRVVEAKFQITLGQTHLASEDFSEAESAFKRVAEEAKDIAVKDGDLLLAAANEGLAKVALAQGNMDLARARLDVVLALNPESHWAVAEQGRLAYEQEDWKKALQYFEQAVALQPSISSYHYRLGLLYWKAGGCMPELQDKVLPQLLEAVKLDPSQSDVFRHLGRCYNDLVGDTQRAIRCYQKAVTLNPEDEEAGETLCDLLDSGSQEVLEADICRGASRRSRRAFWAWRRLGFLQVLHKEWSEAVPNLQHALRGYVTDGDLWEALGLAYQHLGMFTAALKAYGRATSLGGSPSVFALLQSGNILLLLGSFDKATEMFREALQQAPSHVGGLCGLGAAMLGRARQCMSIGAFAWSACLGKDALGLLLPSVPSCSNVGAFWKLLGDLEVTYAQALPCEELDITSVSIQEYSVRVSAIDSWYKERQASLGRARVFYQRALHLSPSQSSLYSDLGLTLDLISSLEHDKSSSSDSSWLPAVTAICGGLRVEGDKPDLWVTLGMLSKHKGLRQHSFIQALRIDGNHALAWSGLGQLYLKEGQEALAREAFDRARSANPALPLPWAGMAYVHSLAENPKGLQEAYASCLYAVQLSPAAEVQVGLGTLAAHTNQLQAVEVYTALQQAVHHAPHRVEAHNLKGLSCESRGNFEGAIKAFQLARHLLALSKDSEDGPSLEKNLAISSNLARALCKAGAYLAAVKEYEALGELGLFRHDSGALRGYAVALWQTGFKDKAVLMARKSMEVELSAESVLGGQVLLVKMIYSDSGCSPALMEMKRASSDNFLDVKFCLSALAVAALCGDEQTLLRLMNTCRETLGHEGLIQAHFLAAASKQISGNFDSKVAVQILQRALHLFPHSVSLRARLGELLLESSSGKKAELVPRCCQISSSFAQRYAHFGALCRALAATACACAVCGQLECCKFSSCKRQWAPQSSLIRQLQRWVHTEPWNVQAHFHLVLCLTQEARAQNFPINLCQAIRRLATTTVSLLATKNHSDLSFDDHFHCALLVIISEVTNHMADETSATQLTVTLFELKQFSSVSFTASLQLARFHASKRDYRSLLAELSKARRLLSADDLQGWFAVFELQQQYKLQEVDSSLEACKKAISRRRFDEQKGWIELLHLVRVKGLLQSDDIMSAQKAATEALSVLTDNPVLHLLHGTLCAMMVSSGTNGEMLSSAVRSLSKAMHFAVPGALPFACILLCQLQNPKGPSKNSDLLKWERRLWAEWDAWPPESRPAELYFQMGLLAMKAQGSLVVGMAGRTETSWTVRAWMQRAVHLKPDFVLYWSHLGHQ